MIPLGLDNKYHLLYNNGIMKKVLSFQIQKPKERRHYMLFADNTPFMPKIVEKKTLYKRKQKHSKRNTDEY